MSKYRFHIVKKGNEKHLLTIAPIPFLLVIFSNHAQSKIERKEEARDFLPKRSYMKLKAKDVNSKKFKSMFVSAF